MEDILQKILKTKRHEIAEKQRSSPLSKLKQLAEAEDKPRAFVEQLRKTANKKQNAVIAEIKKASPSKGVIRNQFDPVEIALSYEQNGAACLSILTDQQYFQGSDAFIRIVKDHVTLPILRKDFIIDSYQVYEAKTLGADCILLIVAALTIDQLKELFDLAKALELDVLVEVHDMTELEIALKLDIGLVGINNRNLKTFETTLKTTIELLKSIPAGVTVVTESGIKTADDVALMLANQVNCFLVGEAFMKSDDPGEALKQLFFQT